MNEDKNNKKISRFANILYAPDLPALYNQGLTDYEILVRLAAVINNNADIMTDFQKIVDELILILGDVDKVVKEKVIAAIQYMYDSGELAEIIGEIIANSLQGKNGNIDLAHMGYILHKAHTWGVSELPAVDASLTIEEELYSALQGNCVFLINGNMYWACAYVCQNGSTFQNNNAARIYVYTVNQNGSLSYVTDREYAVMGHCNSMTYFNGYLYIAPNSYAGSNGGATRDVKRISFDGETLGGEWDTEENAYVPETKTPEGWIWQTRFSDAICGYEDKLYICDEFMNLYSYNWTTNQVTLEIERLNGLAGYTGDGFSISDNYIYMGTAGYRIKRYNRALGYVDWVYQLPVKPNNGAFKIGEVEGFTVVNGVLYLAGFYNLAGVSTKYNTYSITHFYRQNLATNDIDIPNFINWSNGYGMEDLVITVTGNLPADNDNSRNEYLNVPCVQLALDFIETNDYIQRGTVSVRQYRNLSTIDIRTTKPITIDGTYYRNNINPNVSPSIGHVYSKSNTSVYLVNVVINNRLPLDIHDDQMTRNCISQLGGTLSVHKCAFSTGLITNSINVRFAIEAYRGTVNVKTDDAAYATNPEQWLQYREDNGVSNPKFIHGNDIVMNQNGTLTSA